MPCLLYTRDKIDSLFYQLYIVATLSLYHDVIQPETLRYQRAFNLNLYFLMKFEFGVGTRTHATINGTVVEHQDRRVEERASD